MTFLERRLRGDPKFAWQRCLYIEIVILPVIYIPCTLDALRGI